MHLDWLVEMEVAEGGSVMGRLVQLTATADDCPSLQIECTWTLTNVAGGADRFLLSIIAFFCNRKQHTS